jgi:hypothetical protein
MNHGLFLLALIAVPVAVGIAVGLLLADELSRRSRSRQLLVLWRRCWHGSLLTDRFRSREINCPAPLPSPSPRAWSIARGLTESERAHRVDGGSGGIAGDLP